MGSIRYHDPQVRRLYEGIGALIHGESSGRDHIRHALMELAARNNPSVATYWQKTQFGFGIPDDAFKGASLFHFEDTEAVRAFRTSGTSGLSRGLAEYSALGLDLMHESIVENARGHVFDGLDRPTVIRLVPDVHASPENVMAYGMALLSGTFGDPKSSCSIVGPGGLDLETFIRTLDRCCIDRRPVVMIGGSFAFVHLYDACIERRLDWSLPPLSRLIDAGGFKGRSRALNVDTLRSNLRSVFEIDAGAFMNLFGMTELASQLYDSSDTPLGPDGERPKGAYPFIRPKIRCPFSGEPLPEGSGLLEITDLCVLDRPGAVMTGDWGIASGEGVAITGRVAASDSRGCALNLESMDPA